MSIIFFLMDRMQTRAGNLYVFDRIFISVLDGGTGEGTDKMQDA